MEFETFDQFTRKLCEETQSIILAHYERPDLKVEMKGDQTPVTLADQDTERCLRQAIQASFPEHGIKGEEFEDINPKAPFTWVLDPIDGTKTFTAGCPLFGTMIALLREGSPLFGCIHYPVLQKRLCGNGHVTAVNGVPVKAAQRPMNEAILLTTDYNAVGKYQNGEAFERLVERTRFTRTWGDCYGYYLLATGNADIMLDPILNPWDIMALPPIVRGAGARITDWSGGAPEKGESLVAATSSLHEDVLRILNPQS